jgi:hypothetical protein
VCGFHFASSLYKDEFFLPFLFFPQEQLQHGFLQVFRLKHQSLVLEEVNADDSTAFWVLSPRFDSLHLAFGTLPGAGIGIHWPPRPDVGTPRVGAQLSAQRHRSTR